MKLRRIILLLILCLAVAALAFSMKHSSTQDNGKLKVQTSYYPLYDFAKQVGGDAVDVSNITPPGAEPHDFEPSPKALVEAEKAKVFIYNGGNFEPWANKFVKDYNHLAIKASDGIALLPGRDPHFWLDPLLAKQIVNNIRDGLIQADPAHKQLFVANARSYSAKLDNLNQDIEAGLQSCNLRTIVSSHNAIGYFAKRYNLQVIAIAGLDPSEEPSAARLAEISTLVKQRGIHHIFFERLVSPRLADTIAQETGAKTLVFDPIEGLSNEDQKQGKDYLAIQRENLANLRTALACS